MTFWSKVKEVFGGGASVERSAPMTPQEAFTREVEAALGLVPTVASFRRVSESFSLQVTTHDKGESSLFLGNVFAETRELPPDVRAERIRRLLSPLTEPGVEALDWEDVRARLVPLLRACTINLHNHPLHDVQPLRRPFAPFLVECVAIDSAVSMQLVSSSSLETLGVDENTLFQAAKETAALAFDDSDIEPYDLSAPYPLWHVAKDDNYESSRLVMPGWLAGFRGKVNGRPIAIVPHRSALIVGGDGDEDCVSRLAQTALKEHAASPRDISPAVYTVDDDGRVIPFEPPATHPAYSDVTRGHVTLAVAEYQNQTAALRENDGEDVFVAAYNGMMRDDGRATSYCVWSKDVHTLLPEAHEIAFVEGKDAIFHVAWDVVMELASRFLVKEPLLNPPRWRTSSWPDAATLAKLKLRAIR